MDLNKRCHLTANEKTMLSQTLQLFTLDGLAEGLSDATGRLVFHGGTSISTTLGSPRWSEDLDFVISPTMARDLENLRLQIEKIASDRIAEITPGARFSLVDKGKARGKVREGDPGEVVRWVGRWEHPMRIGVVKIKNEFYIAEPDIVKTYETRAARPTAIGIDCRNDLPCATLATIWSDKIMAMSARPVMKWRDVFDMGHVMEHIGDVSEKFLFERLEIATQSYRSTLEDLYVNLARPELVQLEDHYEVFESDMEKWLPEPTFKTYVGTGRLRKYHSECIEQIARAREIIEDYTLDVKEEGLQCDF